MSEKIKFRVKSYSAAGLVYDMYEREVPARVSRARLAGLVGWFIGEAMVADPRTNHVTVDIAFPAEMRNLRPHHFQD